MNEIEGIKHWRNENIAEKERKKEREKLTCLRLLKYICVVKSKMKRWIIKQRRHWSIDYGRR